MNKKGISLLVLIITIVVVCILASMIIANLSRTNIVGNVNQAVTKGDFKAFEQELSLFISRKKIKSTGDFDYTTLNADVDNITYNTKDSSSTESNIFDVIPSLKGTKFENNVKVVSGKLYIQDLDDVNSAYAVETVQNISASEYGKTAVGSTVKYANATINGLKAKYNNPVIPVGFKAINTNDASWKDTNSDGAPDGWNDGLVIQDNDGNEFVWVPVDGTNVPYAKWTTKGIAWNNSSIANVPEELPSGVSENTQITKYGGFYIGRYEAGVPANQSTITSADADTSNVSGVPQSKQGITPWCYIDYTNSNANAKSLYNTSYVKSGLMTGTMWDAICKWLEKAGYEIEDSRTYGNYSNSESPANVSGYGSRKTTGYSEYWKVKNIYDLAGNVWEWTNEKYGGNRVRRGGWCLNDGSVNSVSYRVNSAVSSTDYFLGFRVSLYIL